MAGVALVLDLLRKNHGLYSAQSLQSNGLFSATAAASAAAASIAAGAPFASRALFGIGVAHCDAGAEHKRLRKEYFIKCLSKTDQFYLSDTIVLCRLSYL